MSIVDHVRVRIYPSVVELDPASLELQHRVRDSADDSDRGARGTALPSEALDALAIILTEATHLVDEPGPDDPNRVATIRHAARALDQLIGNDMACPFITHSNGDLVDRYRPARASLEDGAS